MLRSTQAPVREDGGRHDDYAETHPAFGVAVVTRSSGTPRTLFQSDLQHNETIRLTIHRAERRRSLIRDWIMPRKALVEAEMSLAQWGALVSSIGIGSGVPVTIRSTEQDHLVPGLPYEPRIAEAVEETKQSVHKLLKSIRYSYDKVREAFDNKAGVKAQREALNNLYHTINNSPANAAFAIRQTTEAAESVVAQARADIESAILNAAQLTGASPIEAPQIDLKPIDMGRDTTREIEVTRVEEEEER